MTSFLFSSLCRRQVSRLVKVPVKNSDAKEDDDDDLLHSALSPGGYVDSLAKCHCCCVTFCALCRLHDLQDANCSCRSRLSRASSRATGPTPNLDTDLRHHYRLAFEVASPGAPLVDARSKGSRTSRQIDFCFLPSFPSILRYNYFSLCVSLQCWSEGRARARSVAR